MNKKSQAAMEFLSSYGWAILIVIIAIATIAYFGVLNPSRFVPDSCILDTGLVCKDHVASITGFSVIVQNQIGEGINLDSISVEGINGVSCDTISVGELKPGKATQIDITCNGLNAGTNVKGTIQGSYRKTSTGLSHSIEGQIISEVS